MELRARVEGDGLARMLASAERLGTRGRMEMKRGLISGGRKATTKVKKAVQAQTNLKKRSVDRRVTGFAEGELTWVIVGQGKGVTLDEVTGTRAGRMKPRDPSDQPRDDFGRFKAWPNARLAKGLVRSAPWAKGRTFAYSYQDAKGRLVSAPPDAPLNVLYGPAVWKELVKDQSAAAFQSSSAEVQGEIERRLAKLLG